MLDGTIGLQDFLREEGAGDIRIRLSENLEYRTVVMNYEFVDDKPSIALFFSTLDKYNAQPGRDRLAQNYTQKLMKFPTFKEFGYIYDHATESISAFCGLQRMTRNSFRVGARCWIAPQVRRNFFRT